MPDQKKRITIPLAPANIILFFILFLLFSQLHELAHILTGRMICGCFGQQLDFSIWSLCGNCFEENPLGYLSTLAGPVFSYSCMWIGVYLMICSGKGFTIYSGWLLVLINKPFARIFTVLMKGGDEMIVAHRLLHFPEMITWIITFSIVLLLTIPPLFFCYRKMIHKRKWLLLISFSILPMIAQQFYEFKFLNSFIKRDDTNSFMGIADLIHLHTIALAIVAVLLIAWPRIRLIRMG